jgi:hypothetical protein
MKSRRREVRKMLNEKEKEEGKRIWEVERYDKYKK